MMKHTFTNTRSALKWALTIVIILLTTHAYSQQQPIPLPDLITDRPDQTESAFTVPARSIQVESGLYFEKARDGEAVSTYTAYPATLIRVGIISWLELRAEGSYQNLTVEDETSTQVKGFGPLTVGAKVKLWEEEGLRPQAAFMTMVDLPIGDEAFTPENPEPSLRLLFKNSLSEKMDLSYNLAYGWEGGKAVKSYSASIGAGISDKLGIFGEVFGDKTNGEKAVHCVDAGLTFLLFPNFQLDLAAGTSFKSSSPDYFVTTGLSIRLPR